MSAAHFHDHDAADQIAEGSSRIHARFAEDLTSPSEPSQRSSPDGDAAAEALVDKTDSAQPSDRLQKAIFLGPVEANAELQQ